MFIVKTELVVQAKALKLGLCIVSLLKSSINLLEFPSFIIVTPSEVAITTLPPVISKALTFSNESCKIVSISTILKSRIASFFSFLQLKKVVGDKLEQLHITSGTLDEINRSEASYMIEQSFTNNPMPACTRMCSKPFYETTKQSRMHNTNYGALVKNLKKSRLDAE